MTFDRYVQWGVAGAIASEIRDRVIHDLDDLVFDLVLSAMRLWDENAYFRYDDSEENCTVQVYRWCQEIQRRHLAFSLLTVVLEYQNVTPDILAGERSVKTAKRPDLRVCIGATGRVIECKRIGKADGLSKKYVDEGMDRFVSGDYAFSESAAYMIGYSMESDLAGQIDLINEHVRRHTAMGPTHEIADVIQLVPAAVGKSVHQRTERLGLLLRHFHVVV